MIFLNVLLFLCGTLQKLLYRAVGSRVKNPENIAQRCKASSDRFESNTNGEMRLEARAQAK